MIDVLSDVIASSDVTPGIDLDPAFRAAIGTVCTGLGWPYGVVHVVEPGGELVPRAWWPEEHEADSDGQRSIEVPIRAASEEYGTLTLFDPSPRTLGDDERLALERIGTVLGQMVLRHRLCLEADELPGMFAARAAHDLRGLTGTLGVLTSSMVRRFEAFDADRRQQALATLERTTERLRDVVTGLVEIAELECGARQPELEDVPIEDAVRLAAEELGWRDDGRLVIDVDDAAVVADRGAFEEILRELFLNASKHGGTTISVTSVRRDGNVEVTVADDGEGIPPAQQSLLFQPFSRGRNADPTGLGFGLARSRRLARLNGGELVHRSDRRETRFVLTLVEASG